ncbi:hypothetical protein [Burkholderia gladioli]|uniref:hypothetical protein n=1 Tax=Burkholderia gladioli TaxID=28095 RepID=UPI00164214FE|nr:hypothetical protein [Burkholderia gladioli]
MNKRGAIIFSAFLAVLLWFSQIVWVPKIADYIQSNYTPCHATPPSTECKTIFDRSGSVGEILGSIGSLFSGLALVGVAITLYIESRARRVGKKPLIVCFLNDDSVTLDTPVMQDPKSLRMTLQYKIANQGESAINVNTKTSLSVNGKSLSIGEKVVQMPLSHSAEVLISIKKRFEGFDLDALLTALDNNSQSCLIDIVMQCESLEGVSWFTSVSYALKTTSSLDHTRLQSVYRAGDNVEELWKSAAVPLRPDVLEGSWKYGQAIRAGTSMVGRKIS